MTTRIDVIRRKKTMTLRAGWTLVSMIPVMMDVSVVSCATLEAPRSPYTEIDAA